MASPAITLEQKVAIYVALLNAESARSVASRFGISHPTALNYAQEGVEHLKQLPAVVGDGPLVDFLKTQIKLQIWSISPEIRDRLLAITQPMVEAAEEMLAQQVHPDEPTTTISARVPESLFYQFRRLAGEIEKQRGQEVTISSLLGEIMKIYVESGKVPISEVSFQQSDLIMDDIRAVLARHGVARN